MLRHYCRYQLINPGHSQACTIELEGSVVVTGGGEWGEVTSRVALYNIFTDSGFVADLPDLNIGRQDHGCGYYYEEDTQVVISRCDMSSSLLH